MIYFVESPDGLRVKIGTTIRLSARLKQLRAEHGVVNVIAVTKGSFAEESALHTRFAGHRLKGEWFVLASLIRDFIRDHADAWDGEDEVPCSDVSVKMDEHVAKRARIAAASRGLSLAEYLSDVVRVVAEKDIAEIRPEELGAGTPTRKKGPK